MTMTRSLAVVVPSTRSFDSSFWADFMCEGKFTCYFWCVASIPQSSSALQQLQSFASLGRHFPVVWPIQPLVLSWASWKVGPSAWLPSVAGPAVKNDESLWAGAGRAGSPQLREREAWTIFYESIISEWSSGSWLGTEDKFIFMWGNKWDDYKRRWWIGWGLVIVTCGAKRLFVNSVGWHRVAKGIVQVVDQRCILAQFELYTVTYRLAIWSFCFSTIWGIDHDGVTCPQRGNLWTRFSTKDKDVVVFWQFTTKSFCRGNLFDGHHIR